jgi:peptidoglycan/LPS O-acetylase OafA/YrhL
VFGLTKWTVRPRWVFLACGCTLLLGLINASLRHYPDLHMPHSALVDRFWGGLSFGYPLFLLQNKQFVWGYTVVDLVSALFIISATQANKLQQLCANRLLVHLGRISYGFYIWHWPILLLIMPLLPNPWLFAGVICFGVVCVFVGGVAHLSYFGFERRFLLLKTGFARRKASAVSPGGDRDHIIEKRNPETAPQRQD